MKDGRQVAYLSVWENTKMGMIRSNFLHQSFADLMAVQKYIKYLVEKEITGQNRRERLVQLRMLSRDIETELESRFLSLEKWYAEGKPHIDENSEDNS
jgi:hypothetical protein